ncbi:glycosyltransferase family protein [Photobacterium alginatilyticum]|uniref:Glycosyltransferase family 1 protein n=1 Tax=Photobacterium alginatilyticum TaxID=1775171 RepID=A0ABW9YDV9_9GAMM|nr:glycosyltransferase [Photobacterium alginatilyticum]NBI51625.1 glycosyltransferase family 1 protein [Photobacterium alginatilyticum]
MAKILLCFSSHIYVDGQFKLISYYEGLISELERYNNEVMVCNTAEFLKKSWNSENEESGFLKLKKLTSDITEFNPDLVISFNNSKLSFIEELCDCPIAIWQADSLPYYNDQERIKKDPNRYLYFCLSNDVVTQLKAIGAKDENVFIINSGTAVVSENLEFSANISFIGSNFSGPTSLANLLKKHNKQEVKDAVKYLANNFYVEPEKYLKEKKLDFILDYMEPDDFGAINSSQDRTNVLNAVNELGLSLYGNSSWYNTVAYSPNLALAFNPRSVYSLKHNQDIYNSSRVCLNVSHAQAVECFPWRIMDIMASNGCLLSSYNAGIEKFTKGYVNLPMYKSTGEAHELAKRLLNDDVYRSELVSASQACIEEKGRWKHRFKEISEATGIELINNSDEKFNTIYMHRERYISDVYKQYINLILLAARLTPKQTHSFLYTVATSLGIKVDYNLVKSVMELDNV